MLETNIYSDNATHKTDYHGNRILRKEAVSMRGPSEKTKLERHWGEGHGADYKPFIKTRDFNSFGTCSNIIDWKHGRTIELLSQGEKWWYYILRWDDQVVDIREQFPLPIADTTEIAKLKNYNPVQRGKIHMTTDFLVDYANGKQIAYTVKSSDKLKRRTLEKMEIEEAYWKSEGVELKRLYKTDLDMMKAINISNLIPFYNPKNLRPGHKMDLLRHKIATKEIIVNLSEPLEFDELMKKYGETL